MSQPSSSTQPTAAEAPAGAPGVTASYLQGGIARGTLPPLVVEFARRDPDHHRAIFGADAGGLLTLMESGGGARQAAWARSLVTAGRVVEPWRTRLGQLVREPAFVDQQRGLTGSAQGPWSLQDEVARYLRGVDAAEHGRLTSRRPDPSRRPLCVEVSLNVFLAVCSRLGVSSRRVPGVAGYAVPLLRTCSADGLSEVDPRVFFALWWSAMGSAAWRAAPAALRGAGAPGALRLAGLSRDLVRSTAAEASGGAWPEGLLPGAFLQLWKDEATYRGVQAGPAGAYPGHSVVFQGYRGRGVLVALDQFGRERSFQCGTTYRFLVGASLVDVEVLAPA